jgi:Transglycosylase SLT domain
VFAHGLMGQNARGRRLTTRESLARHALGLLVLVLVTSTAYAGSRLQFDAAEQDVDTVADEPRPRRIDAATINGHIVEVATRYGVEPRLVAAIVSVESRFNANAVSRRGAEGLMQLMPETAAYLEVQDSFDPRDNLDGGVRHLKRLMHRFHGNLPLTLAAYNAGENAVINHRGIPPYRETRQYVIRVLRRYDQDAARAVAQQFAQSAAASRPKIARVGYVGRATAAVPPTPAPEPALVEPEQPPRVEERPRPERKSESP